MHLKPYNYLSCRKITNTWNNIAQIKNELTKDGIAIYDIFTHNIKSGTNTMFWQDAWTDDHTLMEKYPNLYKLEPNKKTTIAQKIQGDANSWRWRSCPLVVGLSSDFCSLHSDFAPISLTTGQDHWSCRLSADGRYTVEALKSRIDQSPLRAPIPLISWSKEIPRSKEIPLKVTCFNWRLSGSESPLLQILYLVVFP